jgi:site-specific DNA-methyltransferase (adenine-specific)
MGTGTAAAAAAVHGRRFVGFELNSDYLAIATKRVAVAMPSQSKPAESERNTVEEFRLI